MVELFFFLSAKTLIKHVFGFLHDFELARAVNVSVVTLGHKKVFKFNEKMASGCSVQLSVAK